MDVRGKVAPACCVCSVYVRSQPKVRQAGSFLVFFFFFFLLFFKGCATALADSQKRSCAAK